MEGSRSLAIDALKKASLTKAEHRPACDDQVIPDLNADRVEYVYQPTGEADVLNTWSALTPRMIVRHDQRASPAEKGMPDNFAQRGIDPVVQPVGVTKMSNNFGFRADQHIFGLFEGQMCQMVEARVHAHLLTSDLPAREAGLIHFGCPKRTV